jgi:hypothetical protein
MEQLLNGQMETNLGILKEKNILKKNGIIELNIIKMVNFKIEKEGR